MDYNITYINTNRFCPITLCEYKGLNFWFRYISLSEAEIIDINKLNNNIITKIIFPDIIENHKVVHLDIDIFLYEPIVRYLKYIKFIKFPAYLRQNIASTILYSDKFTALNKVIVDQNLLYYKENNEWKIL